MFYASVRLFSLSFFLSCLLVFFDQQEVSHPTPHCEPGAAPGFFLFFLTLMLAWVSGSGFLGLTFYLGAGADALTPYFYSVVKRLVQVPLAT